MGAFQKKSRPKQSRISDTGSNHQKKPRQQKSCIPDTGAIQQKNKTAKIVLSRHRCNPKTNMTSQNLQSNRNCGLRVVFCCVEALLPWLVDSRSAFHASAVCGSLLRWLVDSGLTQGWIVDLPIFRYRVRQWANKKKKNQREDNDTYEALERWIFGGMGRSLVASHREDKHIERIVLVFASALFVLARTSTLSSLCLCLRGQPPCAQNAEA